MIYLDTKVAGCCLKSTIVLASFICWRCRTLHPAAKAADTAERDVRQLKQPVQPNVMSGSLKQPVQQPEMQNVMSGS